MGNPRNYSLDLPSRCGTLIRELWPLVQSVQVDGGPATTTFLLAMAIPIIVFPIERIERAISRSERRTADDTHLSEELNGIITRAISDQPVVEADFFQAGDWSYVDRRPRIDNISLNVPDQVWHDLNTELAQERAKNLSGKEWSNALRNSLAHGAVTYLDGDGFPRAGVSAKMLCFFSDNRKNKPTTTHCLRISEQHFKQFLLSWVQWLESSGVLQLLEEAA
jgi:hypothetical protein